ncbi:MAG: type I-E CRISPR-associated endonuclease Cas1e [Acidobacteriota bacterium]|nr:type I-E CRISPR-associated endonuclease Cas1e [Blastocatellia bacterium]MDW8413230.1 type I-E CRISPR-associated endonuclease Cas1e [Acidobacteriota bacterium]
MDDLHILPKVRDSLSYLYIEHKKVDRDSKAIALHDKEGKTTVPCSSLNLLMLGPGTSITHAAVLTLAENGCLISWVGEASVRFYAQGLGETRSSHRLLHQARMVSYPELRMQVVRRMYEMRFPEPLEPNLSLRQIRGKEGIRVREAYFKYSQLYGVKWKGRSFSTHDWNKSDPINRALSAANSCLYGICHAAIVAAGFSPALGFIHTGKMLSFVYDIADLYKVDVTVPIAFQTAAEGTQDVETRVRHACRDKFYQTKLLQRIIPDIEKALGLDTNPVTAQEAEFNQNPAAASNLWDPEGEVKGGTNFAEDFEEEKC